MKANPKPPTQRCRLCEHAALEPVFRIKTHDLARCPHCGYVQVVDQPAAAELDEIYQEAYFSHNKYADANTQTRENDRRLRLMKRYVDPGANVLDAGCATGDFIYHSQGLYRLSGFDVSEFAVRTAQDNNPEVAARIWVASLDEVVLAPESFDAICTWDIIEHLWDPVTNYARLLVALKPGGYLFLSTPNIGALAGRALGCYWPFMTPPEHLSFFNRQSMTFFAREALSLEMVRWHSWGKWANVGFIMYKIKRILPWFPEAVLRLFTSPGLRRWGIYVPTGDVQYVVMRRSERQA